MLKISKYIMLIDRFVSFHRFCCWTEFNSMQPNQYGNVLHNKKIHAPEYGIRASTK